MTRTTPPLNEADVATLLRAKADELGGQRQLAELVGVTEPFISSVIHGRRPPSSKLLAVLGLRKHRVSTYRYYPTKSEI